MLFCSQTVVSKNRLEKFLSGEDLDTMAVHDNNNKGTSQGKRSSTFRAVRHTVISGDLTKHCVITASTGWSVVSVWE